MAMELPSPAEIYLDEVTKTMLTDLAELAHQVNEIRPLSPALLQQVRDELFGERVFSSNAIEGNTLTIRETRLILQTKTYLDIRRKREAMEALNLGTASTQVEEFLGSEDAWHDMDRFRTIHEILMQGVNDRIAGVIRNRDVMITGAKRQPPDAQRVWDLTEQVFSLLRDNAEVNGLILATWVHWAIARVHPFEDGNGRMARLWQDLVLLRSRLTVAIIRPQDRQAYLENLAQADEGDFNPLAQLICQRVMGTFQTYLNAQEAADQLQGWASELVGEVSARELEHRKLAYERWRHAVESVRDVFERCASLVNRGATGTFDVQIQSYEIIDQATWEALLAGGGAKKTWFFRAFFKRKEAIVWYYFFFGKHFWSEVDETIGEEGPWVNMLISQQHPDEQLATRLDDLENTPISLREILVVGKRIVCRRRDPVTLQMVYDLDVQPLDVARRFIEEVLLKKLI
jgi:fido (protein-threonine AMPylation protein)